MTEVKKIFDVLSEVRLCERRLRVGVIELLMLLRDLLNNEKMDSKLIRYNHTVKDVIDALATWKCIFDSAVQTDFTYLNEEKVELDFSSKPDEIRFLTSDVKKYGVIYLIKVIAKQIPFFVRDYTERGLPSQDPTRSLDKSELIEALNEGVDDVIDRYYDDEEDY